MPVTHRSRTVAAARPEVWALVEDAYNLPRWWPRAQRVEEVTRERWTLVLGTAKGRSVRADYRVVDRADGERLRFAQEIAGSPFERLLRSAETTISLRDAESSTEVTIELRQKLRGFSRFGPFFFRGAAKRTLDEALEGLDHAVVG